MGRLDSPVAKNKLDYIPPEKKMRYFSAFREIFLCRNLISWTPQKVGNQREGFGGWEHRILSDPFPYFFPFEEDRFPVHPIAENRCKTQAELIRIGANDS
jgi:hypothetical protein